jgi:hypothetical protein
MSEEDDMTRSERENLHKWGKARRLIDEEKIKVKSSSHDRYQFEVQGNTGDYVVGVDIDSGETFCPCPFQGETCSHQIAAHLMLSSMGVEKENY